VVSKSGTERASFDSGGWPVSLCGGLRADIAAESEALINYAIDRAAKEMKGGIR